MTATQIHGPAVQVRGLEKSYNTLKVLRGWKSEKNRVAVVLRPRALLKANRTYRLDLDSKLPDFTFRFRWEAGRLRFYPIGGERFRPADRVQMTILAVQSLIRKEELCDLAVDPRVDLEVDIAGQIPRFGKTKRIISYHNFKETPQNLGEIHEQCVALNADIVKIVNAPDVRERLKAIVEDGRPG